MFRKVVTRSVFTWARSTSAAQRDVWFDSRFEDYLKFSLSCKHTCVHTPMQQSKPQPVEVSMIPPRSRASFFSPIGNPCSVESACLLNVPWWLPGWACWGPICCNLPGPLLPQMWWLRALWVWNSWWDKEREREREQGTSLLLLSSLVSESVQCFVLMAPIMHQRALLMGWFYSKSARGKMVA